MNIKDTLEQYNFPPAVIQIIENSGVHEFYPPQAEAIRQGVLNGKNLLLVVPTAAGKTLIAELAMVKAILHRGGRCLYVAPLKALASEKYEEFKEKYATLGVKVGIATGDLDSPSRLLNRYQILVATAEKVDSLLRCRAQWLIHSLSVAVFDEIHFINDGSRGPTLEILITRIKQLNPGIQILALSATVQNADELAGWLSAELALSQWRPVPLKEGVYYNERIVFNKDGIRDIREEAGDHLGRLTLDTLRGKGQVLVFVNSRRGAQAASRLLCASVAHILKPEERQGLKVIAKELLGSPSETTKVCRKLAEVVVHGVAFHHAGLRPQQRKIIEDCFKRNLIKVICSTPTLAAGVNLPARRAILRDYKRYEDGLGSTFIPTFEYKQCAGRAGRPKYDEYGEAVIMAKSFSETSALFERYIHASPEPIVSKLGNESALRMHVLSSLASGYVADVKGMFEFISHTFLSYQKLNRNLIELIGRIFDFLHQEGFIEKNGFRYFATAFGACVSRLYIDPLSGITLRNGLKKIAGGKSFSSIGLLHLVCCCPDYELMNVGKSDYEEIERFGDGCQDEMVANESDIPQLEDFYFYLAALKTTMMLSQWIEEEKEEIICDRFGIGPGDVHRFVESMQWLLHAAAVIAELFNLRTLTFVLEDLKVRVQYGIREELLELVRLKGVGRVRARQLYHKGYRRLADLKIAHVEDLAKVPQIGKTLARGIMTQVVSSPKRAKGI